MLDLHELTKRTALYGQLFDQNGDEERVNKARLLVKKLYEREYTIAFAGHFSAGKSSMINALTGDDLLPSSPIPTSANIVKVKKASSNYAKIHLLSGEIVQYNGQHFAEAIQSFSKDGQSIALVEIGHPNSLLAEGLTVMDTPGVDSTDDAHRLSTESALHLADLVFYTMDYNHVQSELNFTFTKELMKYNPNVYLIINQIDKHRESELSFAKFQESVAQSFALWGVQPKGIYYTSLRQLDHPFNEFTTVKKIVDEAVYQKEEQFVQNITGSLQQLLDEHIQYMGRSIDEVKRSASECIEEDEWNELEALQTQRTALEKRIELLADDTFRSLFEQERVKLLENAAITPFELREHLKAYVVSKSPRFKVGLFGGKKTAQERARRKEKFFQHLATLVQPEIETHIKTLMKKTLSRAGLLTDERSVEIDAFTVPLPIDELDQQLLASEVITGETVLNLMEQVRQSIHQLYKKETDRWKEEMAQHVRVSGSEQTAPLRKQLQMLNKKIKVLQQVERLQLAITTIEKEIEQPSSKTLQQAQQRLEQWTNEQPLRFIQDSFIENASKNEEVAATQLQQVEETIHMASSNPEEHVTQRALQVAQAIAAIDGLQETATYLQQKAERLQQQQFTVALFGAFSAGKSSFSNALIGERVLPVSPNPTTAAINRIRPVPTGRMNRSADVHLKTVARMTADVVASFAAFSLTVSNLDEAYQLAPTLLEKEVVEERLHIHKSFIQAFHKGYSQHRSLLGQTIETNQADFTRYVAEEERSCFVEAIDFYIDCPLTRQGITLVDTPGADSINARHTDVAFDYIRNADAILFITYYNHAFSRADREFLIQLGRVKDAFELDKMFFIVNAIDLAANEEEAHLVKSFVADQLLSFGIRQARVHGISSLQALEAKQQQIEDPLMQLFEQHFYTFLQSDLKGLAVQALQEETEKAVARLASMITRVEENQLRKAERLEELKHLEQLVRERFSTSFMNVWEKAVFNEINELIYYVLQRVFLRFNDFFREGYSPVTFAQYSTDRALQIALRETVEMVGFDLVQELKVTNLRVAHFLKKQVTHRQRQETQQLAELDRSLTFTQYETAEMEMLTFSMPFDQLDRYRSVHSLFKNHKSFFEKGERDQLKRVLEQLLQEDAKLYLAREKDRLTQWAVAWIEREAEGFRQHLLKESLQFIALERSLLEHEEQLEEWRTIYTSLQKELV